MASSLRWAIALTLAAVAGQAAERLVGESERRYRLAPGNDEIRGLALDDDSGDAPQLYVLDASGTIFIYGVPSSPDAAEELSLVATAGPPPPAEGPAPASPRSLAFALEGGEKILYFLSWEAAGEEVESLLCRHELSSGETVCTDLTLYPFRIGDREVLGLAHQNGNLFVSFDASGYHAEERRVRRGIVKLRWSRTRRGALEFVEHLPDSGEEPARALAAMNLSGAHYLWGTVGERHLYCADGPSGRGLFHFERPGWSGEVDAPRYWGLGFGADALWVAEPRPGRDAVHRVNVTRNLDAAALGPRILRHLVMTIETEPERPVARPGKVYHYYSRPYSGEQMPNQGIWAETESVVEVSAVANGRVGSFSYDPANDKSSRQHMRLVEYDEAPARSYSSRYEIDLWTNPYRKFVYPHRVDRDEEALEGTDYLADDPVLFNLADAKTYDDFFDRVRSHIEAKYGTPADLANPYWAARNVLEYIQDHYYYPSRDKRVPATVDYDRSHYDANPGNLKIELSAADYDRSQIIACSGTSVMLSGAMRYLGFPARWLGTGTERGPETWDANGNGLLDRDESAPCTSGHRYTQVWLGSNYGWINFDATPSRPPDNDYDPPPPTRSQWRFMNRAAAGHLKDKRIVFNVGSGLFRPLFREFEYDEELALDNNCGGDQRYNLQGRFDDERLWRRPRQRISVENVCFIEDVAVTRDRDGFARVTWRATGDWHKDPGATVSIQLQRVSAQAGRAQRVAVVAAGVDHGAGSARIDLGDRAGEGYRILITKDGDPETGGVSDTFAIGGPGDRRADP